MSYTFGALSHAGCAEDIGPGERGNSCKVCLDCVHTSDRTVVHTSCSTAFHAWCFNQWSRSCSSRGEDVTCPVCLSVLAMVTDRNQQLSENSNLQNALQGSFFRSISGIVELYGTERTLRYNPEHQLDAQPGQLCYDIIRNPSQFHWAFPGIEVVQPPMHWRVVASLLMDDGSVLIFQSISPYIPKYAVYPVPAGVPWGKVQRLLVPIASPRARGQSHGNW